MADQVIQEIKERLDIVEVIGSYLQLKRAGVNFRANCPFHNEKTPSFNVNPARQIWHCFGCSEGGDVFTFVQKYEHMEFPEVLKLLADRAGVVLPERRPEDAKQQDMRERVYRVNAFASKFYHQLLFSKQGVGALSYITERGLTEDTLRTWEVGYAPDEYQVLEKMLLSKGAAKQDMVLAGVSAQSSRGTYDRFRGRITFPIFDFAGKPVGFSARILPSGKDSDQQSAKYINSPESPVYIKSQVLFGLYQAKMAVREQDYAVIVEGQMDCIKAHQAGFRNTVATSGTALTQQQLRLLGRLTKNLKLCFDADTAGQRAAKKAGTLALELGFSVKLVTVKGAKDADELISISPKLWEKALQESVWFVEHFITEADGQYSPRSVAQQKFVAQEVIPLIQLLPDPLERDRYTKEVSERFGFSQAVVVGMVRDAAKQPHPEQRNTEKQYEDASPGGIVVGVEPIPAHEKNMLGVFLINPSLMQQWQAEGGTMQDFTTTTTQRLVGRIMAGERDSVLQETLAQEALFMLESEKTSFDGNEAVFQLELQKYIYTFRLTALKNQQQQATAAIRTAEAGNNPQLLQDLQREFVELSARRLVLERKIQSL